jgi:hypothetical protein
VRDVFEAAFQTVGYAVLTGAAVWLLMLYA